MLSFEIIWVVGLSQCNIGSWDYCTVVALNSRFRCNLENRIDSADHRNILDPAGPAVLHSPAPRSRTLDQHSPAEAEWFEKEDFGR